MMKFSILVLAAMIGLALPAWAESPTSDASAPAAAPAPDSAPSAAAAAKVKEIRAACRAQVKEQGIKGQEKGQAVSACVVKQRPDLAQREQCRMDGRSKGLRKDELRSFVKDCVKGKG